MIVRSLIGFLALLVCLGCGKPENPAAQRDMKTRNHMAKVYTKVAKYYADNGKLPDSLEGLELGDEAKDTWGRPLTYAKTGDNKFTLSSQGADGAAGGEGMNEDIVKSYTVVNPDEFLPPNIPRK